MPPVFDELLSEVRDVAAPEHKLPKRRENNTTSSQVLGNAVTGDVGTSRDFSGVPTNQEFAETDAE